MLDGGVIMRFVCDAGEDTWFEIESRVQQARYSQGLPDWRMNGRRALALDAETQLGRDLPGSAPDLQQGCGRLVSKPTQHADPKRGERKPYDHHQATQPMFPDWGRSRSACRVNTGHVFGFSTQPKVPYATQATNRRNRAASVMKLTDMRDVGGQLTQKAPLGRKATRGKTSI
jgi:hypothetical protein